MAARGPRVGGVRYSPVVYRDLVSCATDAVRTKAVCSQSVSQDSKVKVMVNGS